MLTALPGLKLCLGDGRRLRSLKDATKKMSKSDPSPDSRILLTDSNDQIATKIRRAKTDSLNMPLAFDPEVRPEISNLISIYSVVTGDTIDSVVRQYSSSTYGRFKERLIEVACVKIRPIADRIAELRAEEAFIDTILRDGGERASELAHATLKEVRGIVGLS